MTSSFVSRTHSSVHVCMHTHHQPGYLLARSAGDAEAVLEHVQPFFYECAPFFFFFGRVVLP